MKKLIDDYGPYLFGIFAIAVVIAIIWANLLDDRKKNEEKMKCEALCGVKKSILLFDVCHCKSETGWEKTK